MQQKKFKSDDEVEAEKLMSDFIQQFCNIPLDKLSPQDAVKQLNNLKVAIDNSKNKTIQSILQEETEEMED